MRRLVRWLALLLAGAVALVLLIVLLLRWLDPPTSAFMIEARYEAWRTGEPGFALRYRWVEIGAHV